MSAYCSSSRATENLLSRSPYAASKTKALVKATLSIALRASFGVGVGMMNVAPKPIIVPGTSHRPAIRSVPPDAPANKSARTDSVEAKIKTPAIVARACGGDNVDRRLQGPVRAGQKSFPLPLQ